MASPRTARANSRDAILEVFARQVALQGYSDTSLGEIASELGLSKGTIVHHFGSKEQLLNEVHESYFERRFHELDFIEKSFDDPVVQLAAVIYALLAAHRDDRDATLTFLREFVRYNVGGLSEDLRGRRVQWSNTVVSMIEKGVEREVFRSEDPILTSMHIFGMCNYAWTWYRPDGRLTAEEVATTFATEFLMGICVPRKVNKTAVEKAITHAISSLKTLRQS